MSTNTGFEVILFCFQNPGAQAAEAKKLEPASQVVSKLDGSFTCDEMKEVAAMLKKVTEDLDKYFEVVEEALKEAQRCCASDEIAVM